MTVSIRGFFLAAIPFAFSVAHAQSPEDFSGIVVQPKNDPGPAVDVDMGIEPINPRENIVDLPTEWARFAGGLWLGTFGQGVFGTWPRRSSDEVFKDAGERGIGFGVQVDLGVKHSESQALRFRAGYLALGLNPDARTLDRHDYRDLEGRAKMLTLGVMYRWIMKYYPENGVVWLGAGISGAYVMSTEPKDPDRAPVSKLRNTMGLGYQVALGWDYPLVKYTDLGAELAYHPFRSFSALVSLRTSL